MLLIAVGECIGGPSLQPLHNVCKHHTAFDYLYFCCSSGMLFHQNTGKDWNDLQRVRVGFLQNSKVDPVWWQTFIVS